MAGTQIYSFTSFFSWAWQNPDKALLLIQMLRSLMANPKKVEELFGVIAEVAAREMNVRQAEEATNEILGKAA